MCIGDKVVLEPGDVVGFRLSPGQTHMMLNRSDEPATVSTIGTDPDSDHITYLTQDVFRAQAP